MYGIGGGLLSIGSEGILVVRMAGIQKEKCVSRSVFIIPTFGLRKGKLRSFFMTAIYVSLFQRGHSLQHDKYPDDIRPLFTYFEACCGLP